MPSIARVTHTVPVHRDREAAPRVRVRFVAGPSVDAAPGGGETQLAATIDALRRTGVDARMWHVGHGAWDLCDVLHLMGSHQEHLRLLRAARVRKKPVVVSPVAWFDRRSYWRSGRSFPRRLAGCVGLEARRFAPWLPGWRRELYRGADLLLPNSRAEAGQLVRLFGVDPDRIRVVPNGTDLDWLGPDPAPFIERYGLNNFVLCAGRIEPRKNQLDLVRAMHGTGVTVVILGQTVPGHESYAQSCRAAADERVVFLPRMPHGSALLASAYAACGCLVLPSDFETPGLVALEAAVTGTPLVLTRVGAAPEYFGSHARYVPPGDRDGLRREVLAALAGSRSSELAAHVRENFTWQQTACSIRDVYAAVV